MGAIDHPPLAGLRLAGQEEGITAARHGRRAIGSRRPRCAITAGSSPSAGGCAAPVDRGDRPFNLLAVCRSQLPTGSARAYPEASQRRPRGYPEPIHRLPADYPQTTRRLPRG
ncbi:uncharacterized protein UV8b_01406 [Ustilaginoidea virens]|uniref:Uncharacterized protein n=1 Tax=Ustilaginoidea virens TaxID=1159556 RepID=A0A8E5HKK3_USTVR|nr:uncharacterized protein UV8b_01406 [Ustilaginoidea virens]QUC17165.1 hypothetical protein UV8b_01406 [Ustilaginoidea virens]